MCDFQKRISASGLRLHRSLINRTANWQRITLARSQELNSAVWLLVANVCIYSLLRPSREVNQEFWMWSSLMQIRRLNVVGEPFLRGKLVLLWLRLPVSQRVDRIHSQKFVSLIHCKFKIPQCTKLFNQLADKRKVNLK